MTLGIEPLEVDPIARILQEVAVRVNKNVLSLFDALMDIIWSIPHGIKIPFSQFIISLIIGKN